LARYYFAPAISTIGQITQKSIWILLAELSNIVARQHVSGVSHNLSALRSRVVELGPKRSSADTVSELRALIVGSGRWFTVRSLFLFGQDTLLCISLSSHVGLGLSVSNFCTARLVCRSFNQYNSVLSYPSTSSSSSLSRRQLILLVMILSFSQRKSGLRPTSDTL